MRRKYSFSAFVLLAPVAALLCLWFFREQSVQAAENKAVSKTVLKWVKLQDYDGKPSRSIWVNLDRADTIEFYTTSYGSQQNVPQSMISLGRNQVEVIEPTQIAFLRRYLQTH